MAHEVKTTSGETFQFTGRVQLFLDSALKWALVLLGIDSLLVSRPALPDETPGVVSGGAGIKPPQIVTNTCHWGDARGFGRGRLITAPRHERERAQSALERESCLRGSGYQ